MWNSLLTSLTGRSNNGTITNTIHDEGSTPAEPTTNPPSASNNIQSVAGNPGSGGNTKKNQKKPTGKKKLSKPVHRVGTNVAKEFFDEKTGESRLFSGKVREYFPRDNTYGILYDEDGDEEVITEEELSNIVVATSTGGELNSGVSNNKKKSAVGSRKRAHSLADGDEGCTEEEDGESQPPPKKKKKTKDPNAPKRPMNQYTCFARAKREEVVNENPGATFAQIVSMELSYIHVYYFMCI